MRWTLIKIIIRYNEKDTRLRVFLIGLMYFKQVVWRYVEAVA